MQLVELEMILNDILYKYMSDEQFAQIDPQNRVLLSKELKSKLTDSSYRANFDAERNAIVIYLEEAKK